MNFLFPISVSASTLVTGWLVQRYMGAQTPFAIVSYALSISLLGLAVIEHWFMVLPLPSERLWSWAFRDDAGGRDGAMKRGIVEAP
jgi:putative photosynthetic complex assembly protein 2